MPRIPHEVRDAFAQPDPISVSPRTRFDLGAGVLHVWLSWALVPAVVPSVTPFRGQGEQE